MRTNKLSDRQSRHKCIFILHAALLFVFHKLITWMPEAPSVVNDSLVGRSTGALALLRPSEPGSSVSRLPRAITRRLKLPFIFEMNDCSELEEISVELFTLPLAPTSPTTREDECQFLLFGDLDTDGSITLLLMSLGWNSELPRVTNISANDGVLGGCRFLLNNCCASWGSIIRTPTFLFGRIESTSTGSGSSSSAGCRPALASLLDEKGRDLDRCRDLCLPNVSSSSTKFFWMLGLTFGLPPDSLSRRTPLTPFGSASSSSSSSSNSASSSLASVGVGGAGVVVEVLVVGISSGISSSCWGITIWLSVLRRFAANWFWGLYECMLLDIMGRGPLGVMCIGGALMSLLVGVMPATGGPISGPIGDIIGPAGIGNK